MFITYENFGVTGESERDRHATFAQAFYALKNNPNCLFIEEDSDHEGCADAYMAGGVIYSIEPLERFAKRNPHAKEAA
ncbi:hypothetical protein vBCbaSRXM_11 [Citromicrobium phage vB_CbaS-RXM]|nr:hypothetical protein vBCbaSRXM_11 [Citromicrobium phage vB_CbaS-RXM]